MHSEIDMMEEGTEGESLVTGLKVMVRETIYTFLLAKKEERNCT